MKIQIETIPTDQNARFEIDTVATCLLNNADENTSRKQVAEIVMQHGFAAHVGGHHVAIHHKTTDGLICGERLALVTHESPDFS